MTSTSPFALEDAVDAGDLAAVRVLLDAGADPNAECHGLDQPIVSLAVRRSDVEMVRLLYEYGADIRAASSRPALHEAASSNDGNQIVRLLLDLGWDPNERDDAGWTPLHRAASLGYEENVEVLLAGGADPAAETNNNLTAVDLAERNGHHHVRARLLR